jgi:hypothetical protein
MRTTLSKIHGTRDLAAAFLFAGMSLEELDRLGASLMAGHRVISEAVAARPELRGQLGPVQAELAGVRDDVLTADTEAYLASLEAGE